MMIYKENTRIQGVRGGKNKIFTILGGKNIKRIKHSPEGKEDDFTFKIKGEVQNKRILFQIIGKPIYEIGNSIFFCLFCFREILIIFGLMHYIQTGQFKQTF